jgi:Zn-dependent protease
VPITWKLGRIRGIEVGLHYSWFLVALWLLFGLSAHFHTMHRGWDSAALWAAALLTTLLFFLALTGHELAHAVIGNRRGMQVRSITLFALGGTAQAERDAPDPRAEFWVAIAGPIASAAIGLGSLACAYAIGWRPGVPAASPEISVAAWVGYINLWTAVFNLLPAYPLDGGRVLRAALWAIHGGRERSLGAAAQAGRAIGMALIVVGAALCFAQTNVALLWIAIVGWFILHAATGAYARIRILEALSGVRVRDVMLRDCPVVDRRTNLREVITAYILDRPAPQSVLVTESGEVVGLVTPLDLREIPRPQWPYLTAGDVLSPIEDNRTTSPDASVMEALEHMGRENVSQLAVASEGRLEGIISRSAVACFLQQRAQ